MKWDNNDKQFEPLEDDSGSNDNNISPESEKKLKRWGDYYEYDPSGNSHDRKLSADSCTDKVSITHYLDGECFKKEGSQS